MITQVEEEQLKDYAVIYEGTRISCSEAIKYLQKGGFHPAILENPSLQTRGSSFNLYHVIVPKDEIQSAQTHLETWEQQNRSEVKQLSSLLGRQVRISFLLTLPFVVIFYFAGIFVDGFIFLFLIWAGFLIFIANKDRIFKKTDSQNQNKSEN